MHFLLLEEVWLTFGVAAAVYGVYLNTSESVYFKFLLLKLFQSNVKQRFSLLRVSLTIGWLCLESPLLPRKKGKNWALVSVLQSSSFTDCCCGQLKFECEGLKWLCSHTLGYT